MYTLQGKTRPTRTQRIAALRETLTALDKVTAPEKKGFQHNPQHVDWPIRKFVPSFSPEPANEAVEKAKHLSMIGY
jgi:hypothetical protein